MENNFWYLTESHGHFNSVRSNIETSTVFVHCMLEIIIVMLCYDGYVFMDPTKIL